MSKTINELSLTSNLGLGATTGTTGTMGTMSTGTSTNTPGSQSQKILKTTTALTKQINDLTNKIVAAKQKAITASGTEQKTLVNTVGLLQQQLQQLMASEQEEEIMSGIKKQVAGIYKKAGRLGGQAIGASTRIPGAGSIGGKIGEYNAKSMSKFIGLESKNNTDKNINNSTDTMKKNKKKKQKVEEGIFKKAIGGTLGGLAGSAIGGLAGTAIGGPIGGYLGAQAAGPLAGMGAKMGTAAGQAAGETIGKAVGGFTGTGAGAEFMDDDEENVQQLTPIQDKVVNALAKRKYYVNRVSYQFAEEEGGPTVFMTMKPNHYTSRYAEVSPDGLVNGEKLEDFLSARDENEERMLSKKQQRIAKLAGDPNKIDGADFAKLKAMKEAVEHCKYAKKGCKCNKCKECKANQPVKENLETINFLKAVSKKNYAEADKYLGSLVNEKIKKLISKAAK